MENNISIEDLIKPYEIMRKIVCEEVDRMRDENKLIFKGTEYELIEIQDSKYRIFGEYQDIGYKIEDNSIPLYECSSIKIKDKLYGLKLWKTN